MFREVNGRISGVLAVCAALATGCGTADRTVETSSSVTAAPAVFGPSCPTNRAIWYGLPADTSLPAISGKGGVWEASPLFRGDGPPGLAGYWSLTWVPNAATASAPPDLASLAAAAATYSAVPVQPDCSVVAPLATLSDGVWATLRSKNDTQDAQLTTLPPAKSLLGVRVAVIDSAATPYASTTNDTFAHGRTVGRAIRELSCPSDATATAAAPCMGQVSNFPALVQLTPTTTNTTLGGYFGTQSELAVAIVQAVSSWLAEPAATKPPHLLLNLSVGWDPNAGYGGAYVDDPSTLPPAARAVQAAITHAVCRGALVVVAAGNQSSPGSSGPMFPAAWETHPAPTVAQCTEFEGASTLTADPATVTYRPLVHSVGALDATDAPLSNTRVAGRPRMAAYGENVVTSDSRTVHTAILTGTSMAAANVSGIAAAAWGYQPTATANQIMELVYDNAVALTATADYATGSLHPTVHRASLCNAVKAASGASVTCATPAAFAGQPVTFNWPALAAGFATTAVVGTAATSAILPTSTTALAEPWTTSQPGSPSCTVCSHNGPVAYLGTNDTPSPWSSPLGVLTMNLREANGTTTTQYVSFIPPAPSAVNGANYAVTLPAPTVSGTLTSATVTWQVTEGTLAYQTTAPLLLGPAPGGGNNPTAPTPPATQ